MGTNPINYHSHGFDSCRRHSRHAFRFSFRWNVPCVANNMHGSGGKVDEITQADPQSTHTTKRLWQRKSEMSGH